MTPGVKRYLLLLIPLLAGSLTTYVLEQATEIDGLAGLGIRVAVVVVVALAVLPYFRRLGQG